MDYIKENIKDGVNLHLIINDNFKTDYTVIFLTVPLEKETVTQNALIPAVLKRGCSKYDNFKKITEELEMMYGAFLECGVDKEGDNLILKFFIESINDNFLPEKNNNIIKSIDMLINIVFNPILENGKFKENYINTEKQNLELLINTQKDDKDQYAYEKCINIMYKDTGFGLNKYGSIESLNKINSENLYEHYKNLINDSKIDIFISGNINKEEIINQIKDNQFIKSLKPREGKINENHYKKELKQKIENAQEKIEEMDVSQGKLVIGLDILPNDLGDFRFIAILYNAIFGDGVNSKLFQIVREKESLAYTAKSLYINKKNNIFIKCGIEISKYEKTVNLIKQLLEDMKNGNFTEEDLQVAKEYIIAGINCIEAEQDTQIIFLFGQELSNLHLTVEEYKKNIEEVKHEDIVKLANLIQLNTIYFLRNGGKNADN